MDERSVSIPQAIYALCIFLLQHSYKTHFIAKVSNTFRLFYGICLIPKKNDRSKTLMTTKDQRLSNQPFILQTKPIGSNSNNVEIHNNLSRISPISYWANHKRYEAADTSRHPHLELDSPASAQTTIGKSRNHHGDQ